MSSPQGHQYQARRKASAEQRSPRRTYKMISWQRDKKRYKEITLVFQSILSRSQPRNWAIKELLTQPSSIFFWETTMLFTRNEKNIYFRLNYWSISSLTAVLLSSFTQLLNPPTKDQTSIETGTSLGERGTRGDVPLFSSLQEDRDGAGNEKQP